MKLDQILTEKVASIVYSVESLKILYLVITRNMFPLTPVFDKRMKTSRQYYYFKTYKSRKTAADNKPKDEVTCFVQLNGEKLGQIIKDKNMNYYLNTKNKDLQDKLYSDESTIKNAKDYIEQISILVPKNFKPNDQLAEIEQLCKESSISLFFFDDEKALVSNNRTKKLKINALGSVNKVEKNKFKDIPTNVKAFIYFYENNKNGAIPTDFQPYLAYLVMRNKNNNFITNLKEALNSDKVKSNPIAVSVISDIMKKEETNSIEVIFSRIADKWRKLVK